MKQLLMRVGIGIVAVLGAVALLSALFAPVDFLVKLTLIALLAAAFGVALAQRDRTLGGVALMFFTALAFLLIVTGPDPLIIKITYLLLLAGIVAVPALLIYNRVPPAIGLVSAALVAVGIVIFVNFTALFTFTEGALTFLFDPASRQMNVIECSSDPGCRGLHPIIFSLVVFVTVLTAFAYTTFYERKLLARLQQRSGPNRVGPGGWLQPAADGIKLIFKEDIVPRGADRIVWMLAPVLKTVPVIILLAVIPLGPHINVPWFAPSLGDVWYRVPLYLIDTNVAVLWLLALTSLGTYGVVLAGWSSASKYAMLGGLRSSAQMISYELSLGLSMVVPILLAGSLSLVDIVNNQVLIWEWYVFQNPLAAAILLIALLAETNRAPFDLPEAEQELTQGYQTEYSGMKFAMFMMAEYVAMIVVSMIAATLFFGGFQDGFGLVSTMPILGPLVLAGKVFLLVGGMIWVRATLPRIRYDRLMMLGWKVMLPLSLVAVMWTAVSIVIGDIADSPILYAVVSGVFFVLVMAVGLIMLRRAGTPEDADDELDPIITGQRSGIGYGIMNLVGGLIAGPFMLYNWIVKLFDNLGKIGDQPQEADTLDDKPAGAKSPGGD